MSPDPRPEQTLPQVLRRRVEHYGDEPWILAPQGSFTYRQIDELSDRLAAGLAGIGVRAGQTILIMLPDTIEFIAIWCAAAKLGAIEVPVNTHLRGSVLAHIINDSLATTIVVDRRFLDRIERVAPELTRLATLVLYSEAVSGAELPDGLSNRFESLPFEELIAEVSSSPQGGPRYFELMSVMYTSGTTGPSKGVMITHTHAYEYALSVVELLELRKSDIYYAPLPMFHIAGQWGVVYACAIAGAAAVLPKTFSLEGFWRDVNQHRATCTFLLGAMANFLFQQPAAPTDVDNTLERAIVVPLLPQVEAFKQRFGCLVSTTWGSTEVNVPMRSTFELADNRTCGRIASDRYEVKIVDENDDEVAPGIAGEAVVRTREPWILMAGYWNHPDWTVSAWRNLWLHSGDRMKRDEDGNFYFCDRVKDSIRRRGENISSMEVESEIVVHPAVLECAVIPVDSEHTEQEVMAVLVPKPDTVINPAGLIAFLEPRMAYFMVPRYIEVVDALPKTQTGKIQKFELRRRGVSTATWDRDAAGIKLKK